MQGDKKTPLDLSVIDSVSPAIDALVESVEDGTTYEDVLPLGRYVQWRIDFDKYKTDLDVYQADIRKAEINWVALATWQFREKNGRLYEEVLWDWSPAWRVMSLTPNLLFKLPTFAWRHKSKFYSPYLVHTIYTGK